MDLPPLQGPCVLICEGSLEFWDAPWGGREKDNKKRIVNKREEITGKRKIFWDPQGFAGSMSRGSIAINFFPRFHNCQDLIMKIGAYD